MRLDHLLSKEHLTLRSPEPRSKAYVLRWELMGGTFDMASRSDLGTSTPLAVGRFWVRGPVSARCWVLRDRMRFDLRVGSIWLLWAFRCFSVVGSDEGHRPYFENYTVDASILQLIFGSVAQDDLKDH